MINWTFEEIKKKFENKDYFIRSNFIDEYDFNDDFIDYYKSFIISFNYKIKNFNYSSDIIDLATYLEIFDQILYEKYLNIIKDKYHIVIKLSIIGYIEKRSNNYYKDILLEEYLCNVLIKEKNIIVKNQLFCTLYFLTKNVIYFENLLDSLDNTNDWRSIRRTIYYFKNCNIEKDIYDKLIERIRHLHYAKKFGEGVDKALSEQHL